MADESHGDGLGPTLVDSDQTPSSDSGVATDEYVRSKRRHQRRACVFITAAFTNLIALTGLTVTVSLVGLILNRATVVGCQPIVAANHSGHRNVWLVGRRPSGWCLLVYTTVLHVVSLLP